MTEYHYLESLDSVSSPWTPDWADGRTTDLSAARHVQIFTEILMALILGRVVAVPQSYAFDSWGFLDVASRILQARPASREKDHPFRLHLFGAGTFDEAIRQMLARVRDADRPFLSSLMPELNDPAGPASAVPADADVLMQSGLMGDQRAGALGIVRAEFAGLGRVPASPRPGAPSLGQALADFAARPLPDSRRSADHNARAVHDELVTALTLLDLSRPLPFTQRSRLRMTQPWPNDPLGRSPADVAGGPDRLELVTEFVDTIYNAVVAASIGVAPVTFTTDVARAGRSLTARAIAQDFAISEVTGARATGYPSARATEGELPDPQFQLSLRTSRRLSGQDIATEMRTLLERALGGGVAALLAERAATGSGTNARSQFWTGLDKFHAARADRDHLAGQRALEKHLKEVSRILGPGRRNRAEHKLAGAANPRRRDRRRRRSTDRGRGRVAHADTRHGSPHGRERDRTRRGTADRGGHPRPAARSPAVLRSRPDCGANVVSAATLRKGEP